MKDKIGGSIERKLPETEEQIAILYGIIGIGTQQVKKYKSEEYADKKQMIFLFELTEDFDEFNGVEKPMTVIHKVARSMDDRANLYKMVKNWVGKKWIDKQEYLDWNLLLGGMGMMTISNNKATNGKVYTNIDNLTRIQKGVETPTQVFNVKFYFDIEDEPGDIEWDKFLLMPKWSMKVVEKSSEWSALLKKDLIPDSAVAALDAGNDYQKKDQEDKPFEKPTDKKANYVLNGKEEDEEDPFSGGGTSGTSKEEDDTEDLPFNKGAEEDPFETV
jgi:hypothetical protein